MEYNDELYHYGRLGMKWGQHIFGKERSSVGTRRSRRNRSRVSRNAQTYRRMTNESHAIGSKSSKGAGTKDSTKAQAKSVHDMSDDELRQKISRLQLERQYQQLQPAKVSVGRKIINDVIKPATKDASKQLLKEWLVKAGKEALGMSTGGNNSNNRNSNSGGGNTNSNSNNDNNRNNRNN